MHAQRHTHTFSLSRSSVVIGDGFYIQYIFNVFSAFYYYCTSDYYLGKNMILFS